MPQGQIILLDDTGADVSAGCSRSLAAQVGGSRSEGNE